MKASVKRGELLIAASTLVDPNFAGTVVLICDHTNDGSYGLVLNRLIDVPGELREQLPFVVGQIGIGGPVQQGALQVLHPYGDRVPGAVEIVPDVWIGGDFEQLRAGLDAKTLAAEECRFFLGYAGWGKGQLAGEMDSDSWLTAPATAEFVFRTPPENLWHLAVRQHGRREPMFAHYPKDPRLN